MENRRFGKNKERSFDRKGSRKHFGSSGFSSDEDKRMKGEERGSGKRFGSNRKSFSKNNRTDRESFSRDEKPGRNFSSREGGYEKKGGKYFSKDKRSDRSSFNNREENDSTQRRSFDSYSGRYNKGEYRGDRKEKSFEKHDRYSDRNRDNKSRSFNKNDRYSDRRGNSEWSAKKEKFSVKRKEGDEYSERKFKADRETLQKRHYSKKKQLEHKLKNPHQEESFRLNRFIANAGVCSRREADKLIEEGRISVNGKVVTEVGTKVKLSDNVKADGKPLNPEKKVYVLLNKPKDFVTTVTDPMGRKTVMDLIKDACKERVFPVGRLDRMTSGLLLFTNDGDLAKKLTHPKYDKKKIYHAFLDKDLTKTDMLRIAEGFELEDGFIQADEISYVDNIKNQIGIEIHSGKNRIVRRIFEHLGYTVEKLDRVYFAGLTKKNLPRGRWRLLTEKEVTMLKSY